MKIRIYPDKNRRLKKCRGYKRLVFKALLICNYLNANDEYMSIERKSKKITDEMDKYGYIPTEYEKSVIDESIHNGFILSELDNKYIPGLIYMQINKILHIYYDFVKNNKYKTKIIHRNLGMVRLEMIDKIYYFKNISNLDDRLFEFNIEKERSYRNIIKGRKKSKNIRLRIGKFKILCMS